MGNWDAAGYWYTTNHGPLTTVVERLKPESIYKKFVKFRNSLGIEVIPTSGCPLYPSDAAHHPNPARIVLCRH